MNKFFIIGIIAIVLTISAGIYILFQFLEQSINVAKANYILPDTTIVIHNGIPDTVITKKSLPVIFK